MQVINYSQKEFNNMVKLNIPYNVFNTEGVIYTLKYKNKEKIFKTLYNLNGNIFANKLYTVEMLDNYKDILPNSFVIPDYLVTIARSIKGFTLPKISGINLTTILNDCKTYSVKEQIKYLKMYKYFHLDKVSFLYINLLMLKYNL